MGDLGVAKLITDKNVPPKILPCRKIPHAIHKSVKAEVDSLVANGILVPVEEPSEWVSQMAVVKKANGSIRICIDPQPLNTALCREHYRLPVLDDSLPQMRNAKIFSKVDVKHAF